MSSCLMVTEAVSAFPMRGNMAMYISVSGIYMCISSSDTREAKHSKLHFLVRYVSLK